MRLAVSLAAFAVLAATARAASPLPYFSVLSEDAGAWPAILSSIGLQAQPAGLARVFVVRSGAAASTEWMARVDNGSILILEGESSLAEVFGFRRSPAPDNVKVAGLTDVHNPTLSIVWEKPLELPHYELPSNAQVFARDRWTGAPMCAGFRRGLGAVLWISVPPGERGYERFPYLMQALVDLGLEPPFRSDRLWAFFDSAYRSRVDLDYFAARWRKAGISTLHVAAWHFFEPDPLQDDYLRRLIDACHREGIAVYAWLELPHVSEKFWADHPEWREKTAVLQDAQLDWRKLMNLFNRDCFRAIAAGVRDLLYRHDWDGVNLAELYFESLEGMANPARFTPMNPEVRAEFHSRYGFDPIDLFRSPVAKERASVFLGYRADLARRMQEEWLGEMDSIRREKPWLDLVLTHVDDRFDTGMRDAIGADAARVLPLLDSRSFTFLIEDPATIWNLGPQRYTTIASRYRALTKRSDRLAIDLNIVERYQDVYPTRQQTGTELFQLLHHAAASFQRVALYFENSLLSADLSLLPSAAAAVSRIERFGSKVVVDSPGGVGLPWSASGVRVDGVPWPIADASTVWLPAGSHSVEPGPASPAPRVVRLNAAIRAARIVNSSTSEFSYQSNGRAIVLFDRAPASVLVDGDAVPPGRWLFLPRGQHVVTVSSSK